MVKLSKYDIDANVDLSLDEIAKVWNEDLFERFSLAIESSRGYFLRHLLRLLCKLSTFKQEQNLLIDVSIFPVSFSFLYGFFS